MLTPSFQSCLFVTRLVMYRLLVFLALGWFLGALPAASADVVGEAREACATTRDVSLVIVNLRDQGWAAQRVVDAVLDVSKVADPDTRGWFLSLVQDAYDNRVSTQDVETEYQACLKVPPATSRLQI